MGDALNFNVDQLETVLDGFAALDALRLLKSLNLSDVPDKAAARSNLGSLQTLTEINALIAAAGSSKPAFNGEIVFNQTMVAADFDCIERLYHFVVHYTELPTGASPNIVWSLNLPPGAYVAERGMFSKHEIIWAAPGLTQAQFTAATGSGGNGINTNLLLDRRRIKSLRPP